MAGLFLDLSPLRRVPPYRRLWAGSALSSIGSAMTVYAVPLQIFLLTRSSFDVGLIGLFAAVPTVVVSLSAGAVIDAVDRRRLVLVCTLGQAALSALLAVQAYGRWDQTWLLYAVTALGASIGGLNAPARRTFMPALLGVDQIPAGAALQTFSMHGAFTIGPAVAGLITAGLGLRACYVLDACSFAFSLYGVFRLPRVERRDVGRPGFRAVLDGFRFISSHRPVLGALLADASACLLAMPVALFPALDAARFHGDPTTLGLMSTGLALGGVLGTVLSGPTRRVRRQGLGMLVAGSVWGAGLLGVGLVDVFPVFFACLVVAGVGDATSVVLRTSLIQGATPEHLRGRVTGAEMAVGMGLAQLGNTRAGVVAGVTSPTTAMVSGGLSAVVAAGVIGLCVPALVRYRPSSQASTSAT